MQATMPTETEPDPIRTTSLRLPETLWRAVHRHAGAKAVSVNAYIVQALETAVAADEAAERQRLLGT